MPKQIQNNQFLGGSPLMDATPQPNSTNAVMSGGVYSALDNVGTEISELNSNLNNKVSTYGENNAISIKQEYTDKHHIYVKVNSTEFDMSFNENKFINAWSGEVSSGGSVTISNINNYTNWKRLIFEFYYSVFNARVIVEIPKVIFENANVYVPITTQFGTGIFHTIPTNIRSGAVVEWSSGSDEYKLVNVYIEMP